MPASSSPNILPSINPIPTAAGASTTATSNSAVRLLQSFEISLRNVCDFFSSWFIDLRRLWDLVGSRYERARHGQLGWSDMVQLLALCSLIQGIRVWRKSAGKKGENEDLIRKRGSSLGFRGDRRLGNTTKIHMATGNENLTWSPRCRIHRSRLTEKAFYLQVLHHILCNLSLSSNILPPSSASRQTTLCTHAFTPVGLHTWSWRFSGSVQPTPHESRQRWTMSRHRSTRLWTLSLLPEVVGGLLYYRPRRTADCNDPRALCSTSSSRCHTHRT